MRTRFKTDFGDYSIGARNYHSGVGRFMTPDPLGGKLSNPQTLNEYAYVTGNPVTLTDPTGLYVCADSTKGHQCDSAQDQAFAAALAHDLASKQASVRRAANAYGKANDPNGVTVGFGDPGKGNDSTTELGLIVSDSTAANGWRATGEVLFRANSSGAKFDAIVAHEGTHLANAQDFAASISRSGLSMNRALDLSEYQDEFRAYQATAEALAGESTVEDYGTASIPLGAEIGPAETKFHINTILAGPPYGVTPRNPGPPMYDIVPH